MELSGLMVTTMRVAVAGEGLVDRVVDDLVDEVVEAARAGGTDVHAGPLADRLEALKDLDILGVVMRLFHSTSQCAEGRDGSANGRDVLPAASISKAVLEGDP